MSAVYYQAVRRIVPAITIRNSSYFRCSLLIIMAFLYNFVYNGNKFRFAVNEYLGCTGLTLVMLLERVGWWGGGLYVLAFECA